MIDLPECIKCNSEYTYDDGRLYVCPDCGHEWSKEINNIEEEVVNNIITDGNGNELKDGDTITVIKNLKVKGSSLVIKVGTKIKKIRLVDGDHNIDCKIDGIGAMKLKSELVKKIS